MKLIGMSQTVASYKDDPVTSNPMPIARVMSFHGRSSCVGAII